MFTVYDLLRKYEVDEILVTLLAEYPDQEKNIKGYYLAINELKNEYSAEDVVQNDYRVNIEHVDTEDDDDVPYEDAFTRLPNDDTKYALDFVAWPEVLGMRIDGETLENYTHLQILAHVLFEITFYGYSSESVVKKGNEIFSEVDKIKNELNIQ